MEKSKYWYFRFTKDFFDDTFMDTLKDIPVVGYQYIVIYLEMCALALKQGKEYLIVPKITTNANYINWIAEHIREEYKVVDSAIELFKRNGYILIEETENGFTINIPKLNNNIGSSSKNADRVRLERKNKGLIESKDINSEANIENDPFKRFL